MKVVLMVIFTLSYLFAMLRSMMDRVGIGPAILSSVLAFVSAICMMVLVYLR